MMDIIDNAKNMEMFMSICFYSFFISVNDIILCIVNNVGNVTLLSSLQITILNLLL